MGSTQVRVLPSIDADESSHLDLHTETVVTSFTSDFLSSYLSLCPAPSDAVLSFGPMDMLMTPAPHYLPARLYHIYPHPAQDPSEKRRYIAILSTRFVARF